MSQSSFLTTIGALLGRSIVHSLLDDFSHSSNVSS